MLPLLGLGVPPVQTSAGFQRPGDAPVQAGLRGLLRPPVPGAVLSRLRILRLGLRLHRRGQVVGNAQQVIRGAPQLLSQPGRVGDLPGRQGATVTAGISKLPPGPGPQRANLHGHGVVGDVELNIIRQAGGIRGGGQPGRPNLELLIRLTLGLLTAQGLFGRLLVSLLLPGGLGLGTGPVTGVILYFGLWAMEATSVSPAQLAVSAVHIVPEEGVLPGTGAPVGAGERRPPVHALLGQLQQLLRPAAGGHGRKHGRQALL